MTRDEFIMGELKSEVRQSWVLCIVCFIAAIAALVMIFVGLSMRLEPARALYIFAIGAGLAAYGAVMRSKAKMYSDAIKEIGDNAVDLDKWHDFSAPTMKALGAVQRPTSTYFQMFLAYGLCALMMIVGGAFLAWAVSDEPPLAALGLLLLAGGLLLGFLAVKTGISWSRSKQLL